MKQEEEFHMEVLEVNVLWPDRDALHTVVGAWIEQHTHRKACLDEKPEPDEEVILAFDLLDLIVADVAVVQEEG